MLPPDAPAAVAALLAEGLNTVTPESLQGVMQEYDVPKKQFDSQLGELYLAFLTATLTSSEVQTAELSELKAKRAAADAAPDRAGATPRTAPVARATFLRTRSMNLPERLDSH